MRNAGKQHHTSNLMVSTSLIQRLSTCVVALPWLPWAGIRGTKAAPIPFLANRKDEDTSDISRRSLVNVFTPWKICACGQNWQRGRCAWVSSCFQIQNMINNSDINTKHLHFTTFRCIAPSSKPCEIAIWDSAEPRWSVIQLLGWHVQDLAAAFAMLRPSLDSTSPRRHVPRSGHWCENLTENAWKVNIWRLFPFLLL